MWNSKGRPQKAGMAPGSERLSRLLVWICGASSMAVSGPTPVERAGLHGAAVDREKRDVQLLKLLTPCCGTRMGSHSTSSHVCCFAF